MALLSPLRAPSAALTTVILSTILVGCGMLVRKSYPDHNWEGQVAALSADTDIYFDGLGVPHIFAQNGDDAATAVGLLHARSRRFQMELIRMAAQGRLTEVLGEDLLDVDRRLRLLTFNLDASVASLSDADRQRTQAYCDGINEGAELWPEPLEFKLLGLEPEPWTPRDVVAVGRLQSWDLSTDAGRETLRDYVKRTVVDPDTAQWLLSPSPTNGVPIVGWEETKAQRPELPAIPGPATGQPLIEPTEAAVEALSAAYDPADIDPEALRTLLAQAVIGLVNGPVGGSNGWAIAPEKTKGGHAILAGDPHLSLGWPSTFYEVHINTPEYDVSGATFPGLPMVVIGRATHVAWTLTTSYADAQDLYSLEVHPEDPTRYRLDGEWVRFEEWPQTFTWGDEPEEQSSEVYRVSEFGPEFNRGREKRILPGMTYALAWPGFDPDPLPLTTMFDSLYRARTPIEVVDAIRSLPTPSQNWTFVTDEGNIGYVLGGNLPDRAASPLPQDGTSRANKWSGYLPEDERPVVIDPESGFIFSPNQSIVADPTTFNSYASGAYRALRIAKALETRGDWDPALARALQVDVINQEAVHYLPIMLHRLGDAAFRGQDPAIAGDLKKMVSILEGWDYAMDASAQGPLIYEAWRSELHKQLVKLYIPDPNVAEAYLTDRLSEAPLWKTLEGKDERFWNDPATETVETLPMALGQAMIAARQELVSQLGPRMDKWTWGAVHTLDLSHPFAAKAILRPIFGAEPIPVSGGRHTVWANDHLGVVGDFSVDSGPALRQVVSPGQEMGFTLAGGNSGHPKHDEAVNQMPLWLSGAQHAVGQDRATAESMAVGALHLKAAKQ